MAEERQKACLVSAQQAGVEGELRENKAGKQGWKSSLDHIVDNLRMRSEMVTRSECRLLKR